MKSKNGRKSSESWPKRIRATGSRVEIPVYRRQRSSGRYGYLVSNVVDGKRRLESFEQEVDAIERAEDLSRLLGNRRTVAAELTNSQASEYQSAIDLLVPHDLPLLPVVQTAVQAFKVLGSLTDISKAVELFVRNDPRKVEIKSVEEAVNAYLEQRKLDGLKPRTLDDQRSRLRAFAKSHKGTLGSVTAESIRGWLDPQKLGAQSKINYRRVLSVFTQFCIRRKWLPGGWNELDRLDPVKIRNTGRVAIWRPEEVARILNNAHESGIPALVVGLFSGLRSAEIERLDWSDVDLKSGHVVVQADGSKTASRRIAPIPKNAVLWLQPHAKASGKVWSGGRDTLYEMVTAACTRAGVKRLANGMRHSFASYRLAETQSAAAVSLELGNSPVMLMKHYRELVKPHEAKAYFKIRPQPVPKNLVRLPASKVA